MSGAKARFLAELSRERLHVRVTDAGSEIQVPATAPDPIATVLEVEGRF